ncbi:MAG: histidine phosphatase family protein [Candidatus Kariarchaeaceae archaeon]
MVARSVRLYLLRHGVDLASHKQKFEDLLLTIEGKAQAEKIAEYLSQFHITNIFSSPLKRAIETAEIISARLEVELLIDDRLRDRSVGQAHGLTYQEVKEKYSNLFSESPYRMDAKFPDGESNYDVYERVGDFLKDILLTAKGTAEGIVIVSHPLSLNYLIYYLQDMGFREGYQTYLSVYPKTFFHVVLTE